MKLALTAVPADGFYPWCTGLEGGVGPVSQDPLIARRIQPIDLMARGITRHCAAACRSAEIINRN